jgi:class 3 adenylate cyclase
MSNAAVDSHEYAMSETRKIAAILVSDIAGYSRLAGADEDRILARLRALRSDLIDPTIALHHGRVVKRTGDGSLIEFRSVVDAVHPQDPGGLGFQNYNRGLGLRLLGKYEDSIAAFKQSFYPDGEPLPLRIWDRPSNRNRLQRRARKLQCPRTKYSTLGQRQRERSRLAADICK